MKPHSAQTHTQDQSVSVPNSEPALQHTETSRAVTHLVLVVQQGALLQALVTLAHLFDGVATDTVGVVVGAEQQTAQQGGIFKT